MAASCAAALALGLGGSAASWAQAATPDEAPSPSESPAPAGKGAPPGMVPYDHPVYKNGKRVLWHGVGKEDPDAKPKGDAAAETPDATTDAAAPAAKPKPKPKPTAQAVAPEAKPTPNAEFVISVDIDDACSAHMAGDIVAVVKAAGLRAKVATGKASGKALAKLAGGEAVDFAVAPLDALTSGDASAWKDKTPYVARLANETIEIIAAKSIASAHDLDGHFVAVGLPDSADEAVASALFARLGVKPQPISDSIGDGLAELSRGRIDAVVVVGAGAMKALAQFGKGGRFHLVALPMTPALASFYTPVKLTSAERPQLIDGDAKVDTLAASVALVAVNAAVDSPRAARAADFVKALFDRLAKETAPGSDPAWRDVNLAATLDWPRLPAADQWVGERALSTDPGFDAFRALARAGTTDPDKLFQSLTQVRGAQP